MMTGLAAHGSRSHAMFCINLTLLAQATECMHQMQVTVTMVYQNERQNCNTVKGSKAQHSG